MTLREATSVLMLGNVSLLSVPQLAGDMVVGASSLHPVMGGVSEGGIGGKKASW